MRNKTKAYVFGKTDYEGISFGEIVWDLRLIYVRKIGILEFRRNEKNIPYWIDRSQGFSNYKKDMHALDQILMAENDPSLKNPSASTYYIGEMKFDDNIREAMRIGKEWQSIARKFYSKNETIAHKLTVFNEEMRKK